MKKFLLALCLWAAFCVVFPIGIVGVLEASKIHNWDFVKSLFVFIIAFAYILSLALEGFIGLPK